MPRAIPVHTIKISEKLLPKNYWEFVKERLALSGIKMDEYIATLIKLDFHICMNEPMANGELPEIPITFLLEDEDRLYNMLKIPILQKKFASNEADKKSHLT
jgi:hypothetical protein